MQNLCFHCQETSAVWSKYSNTCIITGTAKKEEFRNKQAEVGDAFEQRYGMSFPLKIQAQLHKNKLQNGSAGIKSALHDDGNHDLSAVHSSGGVHWHVGMQRKVAGYPTHMYIRPMDAIVELHRHW